MELTNDEILARANAGKHPFDKHGRCEDNCIFHNNRTFCQHGEEGRRWRDMYGDNRCTGCNGLR